MTSLRKLKADISQALLGRNVIRALEDMLWDQMPPVGREFGSPDFERLMEEDHRKGLGIFDPSLKDMLFSGVEVPEDLPVQRRKRCSRRFKTEWLNFRSAPTQEAALAAPTGELAGVQTPSREPHADGVVHERLRAVGVAVREELHVVRPRFAEAGGKQPAKSC